MSLQRVYLARPKGHARELAEAAGAEVEDAGPYVCITCDDPDYFYWAGRLERELRNAGCRLREPAERVFVREFSGIEE